MIKIGSVDPGGTTGLVLYQDFQPAKMPTMDHLFCYDIDGTEEEQVWLMYEELKGYDVVVIEGFKLRVPIRSTKDELLSPVRIGFGLALVLNKSPKFKGKIVWQYPTQLSVVTDDRLRRWGLWIPGSKDIRSAMKHLLIYLRKV